MNYICYLGRWIQQLLRWLKSPRASGMVNSSTPSIPSQRAQEPENQPSSESDPGLSSQPDSTMVLLKLHPNLRKYQQGRPNTKSPETNAKNGVPVRLLPVIDPFPNSVIEVTSEIVAEITEPFSAWSDVTHGQTDPVDQQAPSFDQLHCQELAGALEQMAYHISVIPCGDRTWLDALKFQPGLSLDNRLTRVGILLRQVAMRLQTPLSFHKDAAIETNDLNAWDHSDVSNSLPPRPSCLSQAVFTLGIDRLCDQLMPLHQFLWIATRTEAPTKGSPEFQQWRSDHHALQLVFEKHLIGLGIRPLSLSIYQDWQDLEAQYRDLKISICPKFIRDREWLKNLKRVGVKPNQIVRFEDWCCQREKTHELLGSYQLSIFCS